MAISISATPHDSYSSSVGVLGCKINTNRVAYWPGSVDCNNICVKLSYGDRSVNLLRIDQSGGAYDISYDAWVYLQTGNSATTDPLTGGGVTMEYEEVDASECADLIHTSGSKLPFSASNSMNFVTSCLADSTSWVAQNYVLYNICDAICSLGYDELCTLDLNVSNQPSCTHTLGLTTSLTSAPVYNIEYETGTAVEASTGDVVSASVALADDDDEDDDSSSSVKDSTTTSTSPTVVATLTSTSTSSSSSILSSSFFTSSSSIATLAATTAILATSSFASTSTSSLHTAATTSTSPASTKTPGIFAESASASSAGAETTSSNILASSSTSPGTISSTSDIVSGLIIASATASSSSASSATTFSATTLLSVKTSVTTHTSTGQTSSSAATTVTISSAPNGATLQLLAAFATSAVWLLWTL